MEDRSDTVHEDEAFMRLALAEAVSFVARRRAGGLCVVVHGEILGVARTGGRSMAIRRTRRDGGAA